MPGTAQDLTLAVVFVVAGITRAHEARQHAIAEARAFVWALVGEREQLALDVEHDDVAALDAHALAGARRQVRGAGHDMAGHVLIAPVNSAEDRLGSVQPEDGLAVLGADAAVLLGRDTRREGAEGIVEIPMRVV